MSISAGGGCRNLIAALEGRTLYRWLNNKVPGVAVPIVLTDGPVDDQPGIYYNLSPGDNILISQIFFGINTTDNSCHFEIGWASGAAGTGIFHPLDLKRFVLTADKGDGTRTFTVAFDPPIEVLKYTNGVRSITFRVTPDNATCQISVGWRGWKACA